MARVKGADICPMCAFKHLAAGFFLLVAAQTIVMYLAGGATAVSLLWVVVSVLLYFGLYEYAQKGRLYS